MHAHGTFSVSHPGSFLKTLGGMRVDCELVRSRWQLSTVHDGRLSAVEGAGRGAVGEDRRPVRSIRRSMRRSKRRSGGAQGT